MQKRWMLLIMVVATLTTLILIKRRGGRTSVPDRASTVIIGNREPRLMAVYPLLAVPEGTTVAFGVERGVALSSTAGSPL